MTVYAKDTGVTIRATVRHADGSGPIDFTDFGIPVHMWILLRPPGRPNWIKYEASFSNDGSDGLVEYTVTDENVLFVHGVWAVRVLFEFTFGVRRTSIKTFTVLE